MGKGKNLVLNLDPDKKGKKNQKAIDLYHLIERRVEKVKKIKRKIKRRNMKNPSKKEEKKNYPQRKNILKLP